MSSDDQNQTATLLRAKTGENAVASEAATFVLRVESGTDAGAQITINGASPSRVLVGQSPACELRLTDRLVSRRHISIDASGAHVRLVDLGSTNGTVVNGLAIFDAELRGGERIQLGETTLRLDRTADTAPIALTKTLQFGRVLGASVAMRRIYPLCERLAMADVPVLIEGETGTGKEMLAEALHERGSRATGPFIVFDCTAVPPNLVESALFGHERGAFTGATSSRKGVFEQAHKGTLLIDEIGDLEPTLQPKLLRAIERQEITRVGGDRWIKVDVRVLSATRRDLDQEVQAGRFRDDLFFRLAVARIELPPLRARAGDVILLARQFWRQLGGEDPIPDEFLARVEEDSWPGNVRELYNFVARRVALGDLADEMNDSSSRSLPSPTPSNPELAEDFLNEVIASDLPFSIARERVLSEFERKYVERVLARFNGNVAHAAAASGIARRYFQIIRARQKG
jgi:two-component system response regulator HydG